MQNSRLDRQESYLPELSLLGRLHLIVPVHPNPAQWSGAEISLAGGSDLHTVRRCRPAARDNRAAQYFNAKVFQFMRPVRRIKFFGSQPGGRQ